MPSNPLAGFRALILAGGRGSRLYPFTASLPKPLLPVGDAPLIELIVRRLRLCGATRITVAVNYLADLIESFLGDGSRFGVPIDYVRETAPLGTAGPIGLVAPWEGPLVITNGDVLADVDIGELLVLHHERGALLTVATRIERLGIDSGVVTTDPSLRVTGIIEKPSVEHRISLGVYALSDAAAVLIPPHQRLEMPDLVTQILRRGDVVQAFEHSGFWLDIGKPNDFAEAQNRAKDLTHVLLAHPGEAQPAIDDDAGAPAAPPLGAAFGATAQSSPSTNQKLR